MNNSLFPIHPQLFYAYSKHNPCIWARLPGSRVEHWKFGSGTILDVVENDAGYGSFTLLIKFDNPIESKISGRTDTLRLSRSVFESQIITRLDVCAELAVLINTSHPGSDRRDLKIESESRDHPPEDPEIRKEKIKGICQTRGITHLVHFTRLSNLNSILEYGLLSRFVLENASGKIVSDFNDDQRLDRCKNAICLSIQFPSYQMFHKYKQMDVDVLWAVLLLDPAILWDLDCAFCVANAAATIVRNIPLQIRKSSSALQEMFADHANHQRDTLSIPSNYPTHPQAEVLVFNPIPRQYFKEVHFNKYQAMITWQDEAQNPIKTTCDSFYFSPRQDHQHWPSKPHEF